jgi:triacylglycerol lipase
MARPEKEIPSSFGLLNVQILLLPAKGYHYFERWEQFIFDAEARGHSPINAWWLADCALLAYETPENIQSILGSVERFDPDSFLAWANARTGLNGFSVQGDDFALLSFRGTEFYRPDDILRDIRKLVTSGIDLLQDTKLWLKTYEGLPRFDVPVVCGFYQPLQSIWLELKSWIESIPPSKSLWLTGHSLGGAMATLVAFQYPERVAGDCVAIFCETFWDFRVTKRSKKLATSDCLRRPGRPRSSGPDPTKGPDTARR